MSSSKYSEAVLLFGDSLTETWAPGSLGQRMALYYSRRLDVVNRGFSGYNTDWAIPVFKQIFATKEERESGRAQAVKLLTIWFGANDSVLPGEPQHVDKDRFKSNLSQIIDFVRSPSSLYYSPDTKIIVINAPPIILSKWRATLGVTRIQQGDAEPLKPNRDPSLTKEYAEACVEVAKEQQVPFVDLYSAVIKAAGGTSDEDLDPFFYDGLHLTSEGYAILFRELKETIKRDLPGLDPKILSPALPDWSTIESAPQRAAEIIERHVRDTK